MSRTIETNSGSEFFTNINSEQLLGKLCKDIGAIYYIDEKWSPFPKLAYKMTEEEASAASSSLLELVPKAFELFPIYKHHFEKNSDYKSLISFIEHYAKALKDSKGYKCLS